MIRHEASRIRILRKFVAAIIASDLTADELGVLRELLLSDPQLLDKAVGASRSSVFSLISKSDLAGKPASRMLGGEDDLVGIYNSIDDGQISREDVVRAVKASGVLNMSAHTMRKMNVRSLLERAVSEMTPAKKMAFLGGLREFSVEDPYLSGINKKRGG